MLHNILLVTFSLLIIVNLVVLVRYIMMMRVMNCALNSFIDQQKIFGEAIELMEKREHDRSSIVPN